MAPDYPTLFPALNFAQPLNGVLEITIGAASGNSIEPTMHWDLSNVWLAINQDPETLVVILRGSNGNLSVGGDPDMLRQVAADPLMQVRMMRAQHTQIYNFINCQKPTISAIEGVARGAGLCLGLLSDISVAGDGSQLIDAHTQLGVPAGDHSAMVWPILCGLAKAKYYLLTATPIGGKEAEQIGLVSLCVADDSVIQVARSVAEDLTKRSQYSLQWTKYAMNNWLRLAGPTFDLSLALELLGFAGPEAAEGVEARISQRAPSFNSKELLEALAAGRPS